MDNPGGNNANGYAVAAKAQSKITIGALRNSTDVRQTIFG